MNAVTDEGKTGRPKKTKKSKKTWWRKQRINALRVSALLLLPLFVLADPVVAPGTFGFALMDSLGILLVIAGVLGRFWSIAYIGGRKDALVFQDGPYSICRHPLYLFSTIGTFGLGLMLGSLIFAVVIAGVTFAVLSLTAAHEEVYLGKEFGDDYAEYAARVPRILPDLKLWRTDSMVHMNLTTLRGNLFDALVFLGFIPLTRLIVWLRESYGLGLYPVF